MKSLFVRIFLSFWLAIALFVVLTILSIFLFRPQNMAGWESLRTNALNESIAAYEQGGEIKARDYMDNLEATQHVHVHVFDEQGKEIGGRHAPLWIQNLAMGKPPGREDGIVIPPPRVLVESRASADGKHRYIITLALPPGPRVIFGPHGFPLRGLAILVLSSGLVCYFLSWYLTKPIVRLRKATRQLAAGDLTARTGANDSNRRDELAGLMRDFDAMAERLETLMKAQSRLLNDVSHELRSPLARLNVALGLARQRSGTANAEMLDRIELEASRLNELIGRILTLARLEDGEQPVPQTPVPLDELVLNVAEDAEFEAQARHCHVRTIIPQGNWAVRGNASLLHSAVENVVRNAIEPFYRLDDARGRKTGGVGLGLAITERAVRFHGGSVIAQNRAQGGLEIEIRLPLISTARLRPAEAAPVASGQVV